MGKDDEGKPRKEMRFVVDENGSTYRWNVPIYNKEGQPNYMLERLINVEVGDERILEMMRHGARNYIDVRMVDEMPEIEEEEGEELPG